MDIPNTKFVTFYSLGYIQADVPGDIFLELKEETSSMLKHNFEESTPYNYSLAGNIEKEFIITKTTSKIEEFVSGLAKKYWAHYNVPFKNFKHRFIKEPKTGQPDIWVNFQKKGEFNPIHTHAGALSFVIYVKVPYTIKDEHSNSAVSNSNLPAAGTFNFLYVDQYVMGGLGSCRLDIDKEFEGKIILFSAGLNHQVYPFYTSDEYRISVSGNIEPFDD